MAEPLSVAVVGSGYFSQFHFDAWSRLAGVRLSALASLDGVSANERAKTYGVPQIYDTLDALLDAMQPDLIDIVTPPATHLPLVRTAAERGIPVICQKPLAPTFELAIEIVDCARRAGITLVVHENFRFMPWFRHARRLIDEGRLGRLHGLSFRLRPGDGQGPDAYLGRQPYFRDMTQFLIHETGIHFIDCFRYLMGEVTAVSARLRRLNPAIAGEDAGIVIFEFDDDRLGLFDGNRLNDHVAEDCRLTMGEMHLEGSAGVLRLDGKGRLWWKAHGEPEHEEIYNRSPQGFGGDCVYAFQHHVVGHLTEGTPLENSGDAYLANLRVEEAIYRASVEGRRVMLQPQPAQ